MTRTDDATQAIPVQPLLRREELLRRKLLVEVVDGPDLGTKHEAEGDLVHIGAQSECHVKLSDDAVSRIHVEVSSTAEGIRIRDLDSTNGTWVGGLRITNALVPNQTVFSIGHSQLRVSALAEHVRVELSDRPGFGALIGRSKAMRAVFALLERVSGLDETVLITGETGTGKELCARSIVQASQRADKPLVIVDCGALSQHLLESELFGHMRGAFTDAVSDQAGAFERANGGTVFLDEVGELPLAFQTRLLRAVENRTVRRVGGHEQIPLDIRILAATNRSLEEEVNRGTFRADLYYRLSVVQVKLPALRERADDIDLLSRHILNELRAGIVLDEETLERMKRSRWAGNVRELRNFLRRMSLGQAEVPAAPALSSGPTIDTSIPFREAKKQANEAFERAYLTKLLDQAGGKIAQAARLAGTDRAYLSRLLKKHGLT